ncbi:MAG: aminopeptidase P family protein [Muribaculaceae bacterium]|nr:aminopeptidase P family protein [Muribaculaceae bacterium]
MKHLPQSEIALRVGKISQQLNALNTDAILISNNANIFYTSGQVFSGYAYITKDGETTYFVRRPVGLEGENIVYIHKPEQIADILQAQGKTLPKSIGLELDITPYSSIERLRKVFPEAVVSNASGILRTARSVKTAYEIDCLTRSGIKHAMVYSHIPSLFKEGMTDLELQVEIERLSRLQGCLGQFRISGESMELFMGNLLCGENADNPTPYDFAMGGAGLNPSLPVGCDGSTIKPGMTVMVDMNGNFTGYMTDMTRVFSVGKVDELAQKAHNCSIRITRELARAGKAGAEAKVLYEHAADIAREEGLEQYFMGHKQHAGFVGHGVGIEVNELPVIAPRSRDILSAGNAIALEPKFVIPHVGAVGIENTYVVTESGMESLTNAPEEIISLS